MPQNIFAEINNVVLDLRVSRAQTYGRHLKKFAQLLKHADLEPYNNELVANFNLDSFLEKSEQSAGLMVESAAPDQSDDLREKLGLTLFSIWKLGADPNYAIHFNLNFSCSGNKITSNTHVPTG